MKIITRNVNGIRATVKSGFLDAIIHESPDILCLQEIKSYESQIPPEIRFVLKDYNFIRNPAEKPGYAGTATLYKKDVHIVSQNMFLENKHFTQDGRIIETRFIYHDKQYALFNLYVPNGNPKADGQEMLSKKLAFYDELLEHSTRLKDEGYYVICSGDFNVAHKEIDLANPQGNKRSIGFLPEEREKLDEFVAHGFVDLRRHYHPNEPEQYTRRSYRRGIKEANKGWRYDYFWISKEILPMIEEMRHLTEIRASDHCPLSIILR